MKHLKAIYLIRPTEQNYRFVLQDIKNPRFAQYYFFFTNKIDEKFMKQLAEADEGDLVQQVQEVFADYYLINQELISLHIPSMIGLTLPKQNWKKQETDELTRIMQGTLAVILSLRKVPMIKYLANSQLSQILAEQLSHQLALEFHQNERQFDTNA